MSATSEILPRKTVFKRPNRSGHAEGYVKNLLEKSIKTNYDTMNSLPTGVYYNHKTS